MRICLDYQPAVQQSAGIGRYTQVLASEVARLLGPDDSLSLFYFDFKRKGGVPVEGARVVRSPLPGRVVNRLWRTLGFPPFDLLSGGADVFHFPNFFLPPLRGGRGVVTIHDMSFERFPEFAEAKNLRNLRAAIHATAARADAIVTDSRFSAREIAELLPAARGKIFPVLLGISPDFRPDSPDRVRAFREKTGIAAPYLLTVGTIEPRKNLAFLVEVFERMEHDSALSDLDLVIVGKPGWNCDGILARFRESRRAARIHHLDRVPDRLLGAAYTGAEAFVFPSRYEGFGFPPLEAMACGAPVVSSPGGSLAEVLGAAAVMVPSFDADDWVRAVAGVRTDAPARGRLVDAGFARAAQFRWETTARKTLAVYRGEAVPEA
ncbi:MAG: glycosyltransferase family 4 protein [Kiritimatiellia bacterium]|jgi:glycosyltransferase involved in cell wall biosynthesis